MTKKRILVVCTGNSARSQMAEAIIRKKAGERIEVISAGTNPKGVNPLAVEVMNEASIDISDHRSKDVKDFEDQSFDLVLTVCDRAKETCPIFPGAQSIHWSLEDPASIQDFRKVRDELFRRIDLLLAVENKLFT